MDTTQALRDAENSLRDFIASELLIKHGENWETHSGVSQERLAKWKERKETERRRQETGVVDERIIYYADFYDLKTILKKHWETVFAPVFGEWKTTEVYLTELERLRDPDAHRRDLLPHQKHLILGISGELRTRIVRARSRREKAEDCFPRIESARDSLGNIWTPTGGTLDLLKMVITNCTLRPGDLIDFIISARDPEDFPLEYGIKFGVFGTIWQKSEVFSVLIEEQHISANNDICFYIRSNRPYHASGSTDDKVNFVYHILPK